MRVLKSINIINKLFILLIIINFLFKGFYIAGYPSGISTEEIKIIQSLSLANLYYVDAYLLRLLSVLSSTLLIILSYIFIHKQTANYLLSFFMTLPLVFSPFFFIIARYINGYNFILFSLVLLMLVTTRRMRYVLSILLLILYLNKYVNDMDLVKNILAFSDQVKIFFSTIDLRTLFYKGDYLSSYLKIPKAGFFLYVDIIFFPIGLYYFFHYLSDSVKLRITDMFMIGAIWFIISKPDLIITYKGFVILFVIGLIIGMGYYHAFQTLRQKRVIASMVGLLIIFNLLFYIELFYSHFNEKNSTEWGYAEEQLLLKVKEKNSNDIYYSQESDKIEKYFSLFKISEKNTSITNIKGKQWKEYIAVCDDVNILCIIREHEVTQFALDKDKLEKVTYKNGLPAYFIL